MDLKMKEKIEKTEKKNSLLFYKIYKINAKYQSKKTPKKGYFYKFHNLLLRY